MANMAKKVEISVVIPAYNEQENVGILYRKLKPVLDRLRKKYEIIYVDDGSTDKTFDVLVQIHKKDKSVKVIKFRKNFGQTAAFDCGFKQAVGDIIITIDADLQNDPEDIPNLLSKLNQGYDVVSGWRVKRNDTLMKKLTSKFSNFLRRAITGDNIHDSGCSLKAYRRECFKDLDLYGEMHRYIPSILLWKGFKITEIPVKHYSRKFGSSKYSFTRLFKGFLDLIIVKFWMQYSTRPIHLFGFFGIIFSIFGFIIGAYLTFIKFFEGMKISNRPLLLFCILLILLGAIFIVFGILADIMIKIYYKDDIKTYNIEKELV